MNAHNTARRTLYMLITAYYHRSDFIGSPSGFLFEYKP